MTPTLEACRSRCSRCQNEKQQACLRVNGIAICLRICLAPYLKALDRIDAKIWLEKQEIGLTG